MGNKQFSDLLVKEYRDLWESDISKRVNEKEEIRLELQYCRKNEEKLWTETSIMVVKDRERPGVLQHVIVSREITERKKLEQHLSFMAYHVSLTNLPNRSYLLKEFPQFVSNAESNRSTIGILFLDGDDFKSVNDSFGHDVGDEFIRMFGNALLASVRPDDLVSRVGGDEFVILLTNLSNEPQMRNEEINVIIKNIQTT
jgi:GGDEF domain-containing protein